MLIQASGAEMLSAFNARGPAQQHAGGVYRYWLKLLYGEATRYQRAGGGEAGGKACGAIQCSPQKFRVEVTGCIPKFSGRQPGSGIKIAVHRSWKNPQTIGCISLRTTNKAG